MIKVFLILNIFLWLLFALSDAVILGVLNLIGVIVIAYMNSKQNKKIADVTVKQEEIKIETKEIKVKQEEIGVAIDGKLDELMKTKSRADIAETTVAVRAEVLSEQAAVTQLTVEPTKVSIVQEKDDVINVKQTDVPIPVVIKKEDKPK